MIRVPGHEADHRTRIDAAGQESADRHIADHLHVHRGLELRADPIDPFALGRPGIDGAGRRQ
jgi:hypothetical protein